MIPALLMKRNSREKDYMGWSGVLLFYYASCLYAHVHLQKCWKPDLVIIASTVNRLAMFINNPNL